MSEDARYFSDKAFTGHKLVLIFKKDALKSLGQVLKRAINYRLEKNYYIVKGYMKMLASIETELRPKNFAIAVSLAHYWIIFPRHSIRCSIYSNGGMRDAHIFGKLFGVNEEDLSKSLAAIKEYRKLVF